MRTEAVFTIQGKAEAGKEKQKLTHIAYLVLLEQRIRRL